MIAGDRRESTESHKGILLWALAVFGAVCAFAVSVVPWLTQYDSSLRRDKLGFDQWPWTWLIFTFVFLWVADGRLVPAKHIRYRLQGRVRLAWKALYAIGLPLAAFVSCVGLNVSRQGFSTVCVVLVVASTILLGGALMYLDKPKGFGGETD